jgi:uncharacterized membrane protein HdeD (DUF308 family)
MNTIEDRFASLLSRAWWLLLLRGLVAIAFGVLTWFQPGLSLAALVLLFGFYALFDGILDAGTALFGGREQEHRWTLFLGGLLGIGIGLLTLSSPGLTALALLFYIAIWAIARGLLEIAAAIQLRHEIQGEWMLILGGLASVAFGVLLMVRPATGALAALWLIGGYAVLFGLISVMLSFRARGFAHELHAHALHAHV